MAKKTLKILIFSFFSLLAIICVNFFLPRLMPGDPVLMLTGLDEDAALTAEKYAEYYTALGLDKPLSAQFASYIKSIFNLKLGYSYHYGKDVAAVIWEKVPNTLQITLPALIISSLIALALGSYAGYNRDTHIDRVLNGTSIVVNAMPTFLIGMLMVILFAYEWRLLPYGNLQSTIPPETSFGLFLDRLKHLILPVSTLVIASSPSKYLMVRNTTASAMDDKYVLYLKARGIKDGRIRLRHVFRNVCQPFITMVGLGFGKMLSGSIVIEMIFSIDGMGKLVSGAIITRDFPLLQGSFFIIALMVIAANLITDVVLLAASPRVRCGEV